MRVVVNKTVYGMNKPEFEKFLEVASKQVPIGIYAVKKDDVCELKNEAYTDKDKLLKAVAEYARMGFKVYYNDNINPKQIKEEHLNLDYIHTISDGEK